MPQRRGAPPISAAGALGRADAHAGGIPHDRLERLRARTPVVWLDERTAGQPGAWAVLRYSDVHHALTHPELFAPQMDGPLHGPVSGTESGTDAPPADVPSGSAHSAVNIDSAAHIDMDPPARAMLARIPPQEPVDFVCEVACELPETLRNTLAGGLYALLRHPAEYVRLQEEQHDDALVDSAVEEMLRWWTPVLQVWRTVLRATTVGGVPLLPGEQVALWLVSANHDGEKFPDPGRFAADRFVQSPRPHLCFGFGHRACLGARLARVHLRAMLVALLERPGLPRLAGEPVPLRSSARHGFAHLPVRWTG
ncbi:cytochrome P450 [Actinomadura sp. NAK00032]|uniref:cytochrome P450 n=1 Tax=Actinomadura sp. NAK00032 TaxID=2742128 RepID=UPI0015902CB6|nr:cytochrome P450 [Actinomadura sp. NAK00032]QKW38876.1 cytochrome P450 [Actinomadura sp. NAK00032]